jgi:biopolymer transport protein ExbB
MIELFIKGGPIMWPLLIASVLTLSVVIDRVVFLVRHRSGSSCRDVEQMMALVGEGKLVAAFQVGNGSKNVVARVLAAGLEHADTCYEESISCAANQELSQYERGTGLLDTVVTLAPLLGLLGTVTGMIRSFGLLGASELEAPVAITGGIAEALIATGFGLGIAIFALVPLNILSTVKASLELTLEDAATRVEILIKSRGSRAQVKQLRAV